MEGSSITCFANWLPDPKLSPNKEAPLKRGFSFLKPAAQNE